MGFLRGYGQERDNYRTVENERQSFYWLRDRYIDCENKLAKGWVTGTPYIVDDLVYNHGINDQYYVCRIAHTSGTFATDLAAGKWEQIINKGIWTFGKTAIWGTDPYQFMGSVQISNSNNGTAAPYLNLVRTRGVYQSPTGVQSGDIIGLITATSYTSSNTFYVGSTIQFEATQAHSSTAGGTKIVFKTTPDSTASLQESGYIASSGSWASGLPNLATSATKGFLYVPYTAGIPNGTPETITGRYPIVIGLDSTKKVYFYDGSAWKTLGDVSNTAYGPSWDNVTTIAPSKNAVYDEMELKAPKASPAFTGTPTAPTAAASDSSTQIATTAFVMGEVGSKAATASPSITGTLTLSDGKLAFPATQSASSDAHTLDDYEESSSWSASPFASVGSFSNCSAGVTHYTKIGNLVYFFVSIICDDVGTGSGALNFYLPFTVSSTSSVLGTGRQMTSGYKQLQVYGSASSNIATVACYDNTFPVATGQTIQVSGHFLV